MIGVDETWKLREVNIRTPKGELGLMEVFSTRTKKWTKITAEKLGEYVGWENTLLAILATNGEWILKQRIIKQAFLDSMHERWVKAHGVPLVVPDTISKREWLKQFRGLEAKHARTKEGDELIGIDGNGKLHIVRVATFNKKVYLFTGLQWEQTTVAEAMKYHSWAVRFMALLATAGSRLLRNYVLRSAFMEANAPEGARLRRAKKGLSW